jgi:hypothetical protein
MQEQFDAVLYLGPKSEITYAKLSKTLCADPDYVEMRASRMAAAMRPPPGAPASTASPADFFRMRCNAVVQGPRNTPTPGLEALARRIMEGDARGEPAIDIMSPGLAQAAQAQRDGLMKAYVRSGPLKSLTFQGSTPDGVGDIYVAVFEYNSRNISISPGPDGKVSGFLNQSMLSRIGYLELFDSLFTQIDDDKDGLLTGKEYEAHPQQ